MINVDDRSNKLQRLQSQAINSLKFEFFVRLSRHPVSIVIYNVGYFVYPLFVFKKSVVNGGDILKEFKIIPPEFQIIFGLLLELLRILFDLVFWINIFVLNVI